MSRSLVLCLAAVLGLLLFARRPAHPPATVLSHEYTDMPHILISLLTAPRPSNATCAASMSESLYSLVARYLTESLRSLLTETRDAHGLELSVVVCNMRPGMHAEVDALRLDPSVSSSVNFVDLYGRSADPQEAPWKGVWADVTPGMYQLNLDFIEYLSHTERLCRREGVPLVLLAEDDFVWCPLGVAALRRVVQDAMQTESKFAGVRVSYGNNGLLLWCADLPVIAAYAERLAGRPLLVYRHNLMRHIGHLSVRAGGVYGASPLSDNDGGRRCYPACWAPIQYVGLMPGENFADECLEETFSPCSRKPAGGVAFPDVMAKVALRMQLHEC